MAWLRAGLAVGTGLLALTGAVAACSSDGQPEPEPRSDAATEVEVEAPVVEVENLYRAYWDAVVQLENGTELDRSLFDGIGTTGLVEAEVGRVSSFKDNGIHREGEPVIEDVTVTVDGDIARVEACKSEADWQVIEDGEVVPDAVPPNLRRPHPFVVTAERISGEWLITATLPTEAATITCS